MKKVVSVLRVIKEATLMMSSSKASISQVIPVATVITTALKKNNSDHGVRALKTKISSALELRFSEKESEGKYSKATLLDPNYKKSFFLRKTARDNAIDDLVGELRGMMDDDDICNGENISREPTQELEEELGEND